MTRMTENDLLLEIESLRQLLHKAEARADAVDRRASHYEKALQVIAGPSDAGPWIDAYRAAGGGYEGLQAIARIALKEAA